MDWATILTAIAAVVTVIGFVYGFLRNFKNDLNLRMDKFEKRMDAFDEKILSLEERMFWLATGKSLADAIVEERIKREGLFELVGNCIENVYKGDELISMSREEILQFMDTLDLKTFKKMEEFLLSTPSIKKVFKYKNSLEHERDVTFNSLIDFFLYL